MPTVTYLDSTNKEMGNVSLNENDMYNSLLKCKKTFLDFALDRDIPLKFGCMGGSCSACKCEVVKGQEHIDREGIGKQVYKDVKENEILTCIATFKDGIKDDAQVTLKQHF